MIACVINALAYRTYFVSFIGLGPVQKMKTKTHSIIFVIVGSKADDDDDDDVIINPSVKLV